MKMQRVIEIWDSKIRSWADELSEGELSVLEIDPASRWSAWDMYLNWLLSIGWHMVGVLGVGPLDEDRKVLIVVEGEDTAADPAIPDG
jgi:hypothetical protein